MTVRVDLPIGEDVFLRFFADYTPGSPGVEITGVERHDDTAHPGRVYAGIPLAQAEHVLGPTVMDQVRERLIEEGAYPEVEEPERDE